MLSARPEALDAVDVPEPTENGRVPEGAVMRVREAAARLPFSLVAVILLWIIYLLSVTVLWARHGPLALLLVPTVGTYLFSWLGFYRHELWHNYFPRIHNPTWFNFVSYLMWTNPQLYRLVHPTHHKYVHTPDDMEFFCQDWRTDRRRRKRQFILELIYGNIAMQVSHYTRLMKEGRATVQASRNAFAKRLALFLSLLAIAGWIQPGGQWLFFWTYILTIWLGVVMIRQLQWVEHLGIVSDGSLAERNLLTRNLSSDTLLGWLFNFYNHDDAREHVFHHTEPKLNTRGLKGLKLPPGARTVTIQEYLGILATYYRNL